MDFLKAESFKKLERDDFGDIILNGDIDEDSEVSVAIYINESGQLVIEEGWNAVLIDPQLLAEFVRGLEIE